MELPTFGHSAQAAMFCSEKMKELAHLMLLTLWLSFCFDSHIW